MPLPVEVQPNSELLTCDAGTATAAAFEVTNTSDRRLRLGIEPLGDSKAWIALADDKLTEFDLPPKGQQKVAVKVAVPKDAEAKRYSFKVRVYDTATPTQAVESAAVGIEVTKVTKVTKVTTVTTGDPPPPPPPPWKLIVALAVVAVLLIGGGVTAYVLLRGGKVPDVTTADVSRPIMYADAEATLARAGLKVGTVTEQVGDAPAGAVIDQMPKGGESKPDDDTVNLIIAMVTIEVPRVETFTVSAARNALRTAGFADEVRIEATGNSAGGTVIRQEPRPGTRAIPNSTVVLTVEKELAVVPRVVGLGPKPAEDALAAAELRYKLRGSVSTGGPAGTVDPSAGRGRERRQRIRYIDPRWGGSRCRTSRGRARRRDAQSRRAKFSVALTQPFTSRGAFQTVEAQNRAIDWNGRAGRSVGELESRRTLGDIKSTRSILKS
jgi:hypothetical protein